MRSSSFVLSFNFFRIVLSIFDFVGNVFSSPREIVEKKEARQLLVTHMTPVAATAVAIEGLHAALTLGAVTVGAAILLTEMRNRIIGVRSAWRGTTCDNGDRVRVIDSVT
jgi:hypothetical protein